MAIITRQYTTPGTTTGIPMPRHTGTINAVTQGSDADGLGSSDVATSGYGGGGGGIASKDFTIGDGVQYDIIVDAANNGVSSRFQDTATGGDNFFVGATSGSSMSPGSGISGTINQSGGAGGSGNNDISGFGGGGGGGRATLAGDGNAGSNGTLTAGGTGGFDGDGNFQGGDGGNPGSDGGSNTGTGGGGGGGSKIGADTIPGFGSNGSIVLTINATACGIPTAPVISWDVADGWVQIDWTGTAPTSDFASYNLYRSVNGGSFDYLTNVASNTYQDSSVSTGTVKYKASSVTVDGVESVLSTASNLAIVTGKPTALFPEISADGLSLTADLNQPGCLPASGSQARFTIGGTTTTVTATAISGIILTLTLSPSVKRGQIITWTYTDGTNRITDSSTSFNMDAFADVAVTNSSLVSLTLTNLKTTVDGSGGSATINGGIPDFTPASDMSGAGLILTGTSAVVTSWAIAAGTSTLTWTNSPSVQPGQAIKLSVDAGTFADSTGEIVGTIIHATVTNLVPASGNFSGLVWSSGATRNSGSGLVRPGGGVGSVGLLSY